VAKIRFRLITTGGLRPSQPRASRRAGGSVMVGAGPLLEQARQWRWPLGVEAQVAVPRHADHRSQIADWMRRSVCLQHQWDRTNGAQEGSLSGLTGCRWERRPSSAGCRGGYRAMPDSEVVWRGNGPSVEEGRSRGMPCIAAWPTTGAGGAAGLRRRAHSCFSPVHGEPSSSRQSWT